MSIATAGEVVVAVARDQVDVVVKDFLPRGRAVGLDDVQAARIQPFVQQSSDAMHRRIARGGIVFGKFPDVGRVFPRNDERVSARCMAAIEKRHRVLVLIHAP